MKTKLLHEADGKRTFAVVLAFGLIVGVGFQELGPVLSIIDVVCVRWH